MVGKLLNGQRSRSTKICSEKNIFKYISTNMETQEEVKWHLFKKAYLEVSLHPI